MKKVRDLAWALTNVEMSDLKKDFYKSQFTSFGNDKNILFVNPQLSGKELYKTFLPYYGLYNSNVFTALTGVSKYNPKEVLVELDVPLNSQQIVWADFIVLPFTTQNLTFGETNLYDAIKRINEQCQIVFCVDFNYYELSDLHPYKEIFTDKAIRNVEDNIWHSDMCLVTNMVFREYLLDKLKQLYSGRLKDVPTSATLACMPFFINSQIMLENIEYETEKPTKVEGFVPYDDPATTAHMDKVSNTASGKPNRLNVKVMKEDGKWVVKKGKSPKPIKEFTKKNKAVEEAMKWIDKKYDVIIYKVDGTVHNHVFARQFTQKSKK